MKIDLEKLLEYREVVVETIDRWQRLKKAKIGDEVDLPRVRTRVGRQLWEIDEHRMRRIE